MSNVYCLYGLMDCFTVPRLPLVADIICEQSFTLALFLWQFDFYLLIHAKIIMYHSIRIFCCKKTFFAQTFWKVRLVKWWKLASLNKDVKLTKKNLNRDFPTKYCGIFWPSQNSQNLTYILKVANKLLKLFLL